MHNIRIPSAINPYPREPLRDEILIAMQRGAPNQRYICIIEKGGEKGTSEELDLGRKVN
jgi:hypothetical protein